ncbi:MAG: hypothetical protein AAF611_09240 [Bacteroidota bacterium]
MKKNLKKLELNKKSVSDLSGQVKGGLASISINDKTITTLTTSATGPTAQTRCYICPVDDPFDIPSK